MYKNYQTYQTVKEKPQSQPQSQFNKINYDEEQPFIPSQPSFINTTPIENGRITGMVKMYNPEKGFGFIIRDDTKKDIFFHNNEVQKNILPLKGHRVNFVVMTDSRGLKAKDIRFI